MSLKEVPEVPDSEVKPEKLPVECAIFSFQQAAVDS